MDTTARTGIIPLDGSDLLSIEGGNPVEPARFIYGCFTAGFMFGYNVLGPALFG